MDSGTTQEDQGRLTPRRAALAAAFACLPVLVAMHMLAVDGKGGTLIEAHALVPTKARYSVSRAIVSHCGELANRYS